MANDLKRKLSAEQDPPPKKLQPLGEVNDEIRRVIRSMNKVPKLKQISAVTVLIDIWYKIIEENVTVETFQPYEYKSYVLNAIAKLSLADSLNEFLLFYSDSIINSINRWMEHVRVHCNFRTDPPFAARDFLYCVFWTPRGVIDYVNTAMFLIHQDDVPVNMKFLIASTYCLDDYVELYKPMVYLKLLNENREEYSLAYYWAINSFGSNHRYKRLVCDLLARNSGCVECLNYFWSKLTVSEKRECIKSWLYRCTQNNVSSYGPVMFFLQRLRNGELKEILAQFASDKYICNIFITKLFEIVTNLNREKCWNDVFEDVLDSVGNIVARISYDHPLFSVWNLRKVMQSMWHHLEMEYECNVIPLGRNFVKILNTLWTMVSEDEKKYDLEFPPVVHSFEWNIDTYIALFNEMTEQLRKKVMCSNECVKRLAGFVLKEEFSRLDHFVREKFNSDDAIVLKKLLALVHLFGNMKLKEMKTVIKKFTAENAEDFCQISDSLMSLCKKGVDDFHKIRSRLVILYCEEIKEKFDDREDYCKELARALDWCFIWTKSKKRRLAKIALNKKIRAILYQEFESKNDLVSLECLKKFVISE